MEAFEPSKYKRIVQDTTRPIRQNETDGVDYNFITKDEFYQKENDMFELVLTQFAPNIYGGEKKYLDSEKWNIVVVSIEGFISSVEHSDPSDESILINILNDVEVDAKRDGRDPSVEERYNLSVIRPLLRNENTLELNGKVVVYHEIQLSDLKLIRNDQDKLLEKFNTICR